MSQTYSPDKIKVLNCDATWMKGQITQIGCVADVAGSLGAKYFKLAYTGAGDKYYVWYNTGSSTDPAPAGFTAIPVTITNGASAATIAAATAAAINGVTLSPFRAVADDFRVTVENKIDGVATAAANGTASPVFTFDIIASGVIVDMGLLDGDIEPKISQSTLEIKAQQTGSTVIAQFNQGVKIDAISLKLKEFIIQRLQNLIAPTGLTYTPASGTSVTGQGTGRVGSSLTSSAGKLVLHPKANGTDKTGDFCFWKATPTFEGLNFSGEKETLLNISFAIGVDFNKLDGINQYILGDWSQLLDKP